MRILLTGSKGQLGTDFQLVSAGLHDVVAFDLDLDVTDRKAVAAKVREVEPDLLVNAAAFTNVDGAEADELNAYKVNALGPYNLAMACRDVGIPLVQVSTDFVFNGDASEPYTEYDLPDPRGVYGKSKRAGELYVEWTMDRFYICRTSWLFGVGGGNFVKTMMRLGKERAEVAVVTDQVGSPTYSRDLALKLLDIIETDAYGYYHTCNAGWCSWNQFTRDIFETAGIDAVVKPTTTEELGRPAPRPAFSVMRGLALELQGIEPMRDYHEALDDFIKRDLPDWDSKQGEPGL
jgi:dTDP-4-dehydrorhamnose reductase